MHMAVSMQVPLIRDEGRNARPVRLDAFKQGAHQRFKRIVQFLSGKARRRRHIHRRGDGLALVSRGGMAFRHFPSAALMP